MEKTFYLESDMDDLNFYGGNEYVGYNDFDMSTPDVSDQNMFGLSDEIDFTDLPIDQLPSYQEEKYNDEYVVLPRSYLEKLKIPPCMVNSSVPFLGDCPYMKEQNETGNSFNNIHQRQQQKYINQTKQHQIQLQYQRLQHELQARRQNAKQEHLRIHAMQQNMQIPLHPNQHNQNSTSPVGFEDPNKEQFDSQTQHTTEDQPKDNRPKKWVKLDQEIFNKMLRYELEHPGIRQNELEGIFNVNRSTYWRWKKNHGLN